MDVSAAAGSGDTLKLLYAMRERIADAVSDEACPPRDLASLTRRLQDIADRIDTLEERARLEGKADGSARRSRVKGRNWTPDAV